MAQPNKPFASVKRLVCLRHYGQIILTGGCLFEWLDNIAGSYPTTLLVITPQHCMLLPHNTIGSCATTNTVG